MEKYELDVFHDSVYNSIKKSLSDEELLDLINKLPKDILTIGVQWGFNDTEFRDKVYEWVKTQIALKPVEYYAEGDNRIICPNEKCNYPELTLVFKEEDYCIDCGQKLDWT